MAYTVTNFKTKKALKDAVAAMNSARSLQETGLLARGLTIKNLGVFPEPQNGQLSIEGPHYPEPHKWYARVEVKNGIVVKVIS